MPARNKGPGIRRANSADWASFLDWFLEGHWPATDTPAIKFAEAVGDLGFITKAAQTPPDARPGPSVFVIGKHLYGRAKATSPRPVFPAVALKHWRAIFWGVREGVVDRLADLIGSLDPGGRAALGDPVWLVTFKANYTPAAYTTHWPAPRLALGVPVVLAALDYFGEPKAAGRFRLIQRITDHDRHPLPMDKANFPQGRVSIPSWDYACRSLGAGHPPGSAACRHCWCIGLRPPPIIPAGQAGHGPAITATEGSGESLPATNPREQP